MRRRDLLTAAAASLAAALLEERPAAGAPPSPASAAAYPLPTTDVKTLRARCALLLALDEAALLRLVPPQGGFWFSECPNCDQGAQEHQLVWTPEMGETVQCQFCKEVYPNARYPENGAVEVRTPSGKKQAWRFHEDKDGKRYWYEARRWYEQREYAEGGAFDLAQLWARAGDREAGRRAALLLVRFGALYPDYVVRFDYPHRPKRFFEDSVPADFEPYRAAKWSWWAYADVSVPLLRTFDILRGSDFLAPADAARVENDLLRAMLAFVARYDGRGRLTNMHPTTWTSMAVASRVLNDPTIAARAREQMSRLIAEQFFADGVYREGTASYHEQTAKGLRRVLQSLYPDLEAAALDARITAEFPDLDRALQATRALRTPDGRFAPLRDTWAADKSPAGPPDASHPALLPGVGYAVLGMGAGAAQLQAHLGFVGRFGHDHYDSLNLLLYGAGGRDLASDLGYTHSRARPWTLSTASHNTVVIDRLSQSRGGDAPDRCRGRLLLFDGADPDFQMVEAEAPTAYPGLATAYRRALIAVASGGARYVVDVFDVAGGSRHDWLLHGSADEEQALEVADAGGAPLALAPAATLLPAGYRFKEPKNEGDAGFASDGPWAYGMFRDARTGTAGETVVATFRGATTPRAGFGLRTWVLGAPGTRVATARAWAVREIGRPTQEDDGKLDRRMRRALIVGRDGKANRFVAVHCPFVGGEPGVRRVTRLPLEPGGFLLRIERADGGVDRLLFGPAAATPRAGSDGDLRLAFDGRAALISEDVSGRGRALKMIGGTRLACGGETLTAPAAPPARLRAVSGRELTLAGSVPLEPGMTVVVRHGDGTTNGFQAESVRRSGADTVVTTREAAALTGSPDGPLTLRTFPQTTHPGPHEVHFVTRAAARRGGAAGGRG